MRKLLDALNKAGVVGASTVLAGLITFTFVGVSTRYLMGHPFTWEGELQLACIVWATSLAAPTAFRSKSHVTIEIVVNVLPAELRRVVEVLVAAVIHVVLTYFPLRSHNFIVIMSKTNHKTPILVIPYPWVYSVVPISIVLILINYMEEKTGELKVLSHGRKEEEQ